ncbi:MAG: nucleoside triphosphate pyrophosphohydrolase [Alphaproteobacteria bacterium]
MLESQSNSRYALADLIRVMARLRDPNGGCPWDLKQDFRSIAPYTIEEAYEVADAIDRGDMKDLREELGDLLLQPIYHAQMAAEAGLFNIEDVIHDITAKMISRHPHVFGDAAASTPADVNKIWDERKKAEGGCGADAKRDDSALEGVARGLPALMRAQKLLKKAAKTGFEWEKPAHALDKLEEEIAEMREALQSGAVEKMKDEFGDLLFVLVNFGRMLELDAEESLRQCNAKFERRFRGLERDIRSAGKTLEDVSLKEMEDAWRVQKKKEK